MTTLFNDVYEAFFVKIEKDKSFFDYYNLSKEEALTFAKVRAKNYLKEAIAKFMLEISTTDINLHDCDYEAEIFNFKITDTEVDILARLMFEMYIEKDVSTLRVHKSYLTSQDMKVRFAPANERKTFMDMFGGLQYDNKKFISKYESKDRLTGKLKKINHSLYF